MRRLMLSLLLLMTVSRNGGFYLIQPTVLPTDRTIYKISSNDLMLLTKCMKEIRFNNDEDIFITYVKHFYNNSDVLLELSTLDDNNIKHALNISGITSNMTQFTLHGNSITIRLDPNNCKKHMFHFEIFVSVIQPSDRCSDPGTPDNSQRIGEVKEFVIGINFRFSCQDGYTLSGPENITCVRDPYTGTPTWTGSSSVCVKGCNKPTAPKFGSISGLTSNGFVNFKCQKSFTLVGPKKITCLHDGAKATWNDFPPKCIVTTCPANGLVLAATYEGQFIATPGFPGNMIYPNMTCEWDIQSKDNTCIHIYFETFDIPNNGVVFEIYKYVRGFSEDGVLVWTSRPGGGKPSGAIIVCASLLRVSYTSGEMTATGHDGIQMMYMAQPVSEYHAAYQRAVHVGFDYQVSAEPTKATGQTEPDDSSSVDVPAIAAGVTVSVVLLIIAGVAFYIWYRKKYPVRMIIGKDFGKFTNPAYSRKSSTATLTRQDSFEKEIQKMSAEKCVSHDNHVDLSDEQEYQPISGLTLLGSLGLREGLDDLDSPEMKKRFNTKQRKKVVPGPKVVIEEEEDEEKGEVTNISDSSSDTSSDTSSTEEKNSASDENSDGEGFRPVTDAPKIKRKRISMYLNEVLDRQNSHDSAEVISDSQAVPSSVEVVVHTEKEQGTDKEMADDDAQTNKDESVDVKRSVDVPSAMEQDEIDENTKGVTMPDRPLLKLEVQGLNFTDDDNEGSQSSTSKEEDNNTEESMETHIDIKAENEKESSFTNEEIMTEVNNLLQQQTESSKESAGEPNQIDDSSQVEHVVVLPVVTHVGIIEGEHETLTASQESNAITDSKSSDEKEVLNVGVPDVSEKSAALTDASNKTEANSEHDSAEVKPDLSLLEEIKMEGVNLTNDTDMGAIYGQMSDIHPDNAATVIATERTSEEPDELAVPNQDIVGYLTRDEMRELTARTKSFGEDSLSSVYSGEMVEEDHRVAEIAEQDYYSSGLSLDETDSLENPYKNKAEVQFEKLIEDIEKQSNSSDVEEMLDTKENSEQKNDTTKSEPSVISFDSRAYDGIPNSWNEETSDFLPLVDHSKNNNSQTLIIAPSSSERFVNSSTNEIFFDFSSFEEKNISMDNSSTAQPNSILISGFDMGESSTDMQNLPDEQLLNGSNVEGDSNDSEESNEDLMEYVVNPEVNGEGIADDEEDDDHIDELQHTIESGGKGRRKSITLDNPSFDSLDFSKFQQNILDPKQDDGDKEPDVEVRMKPPAQGRRESVTLDNPFFDTDDQILQEPQHKTENLRVIQVSNLLVTPPTSSSESSSEDTESETGSGGEYQVNPSSDCEDDDHKTTEPFGKELQFPDLPKGVTNCLSFDTQNEQANLTESKPPLPFLLDNDPRGRAKLEPLESDVSSLDSETLKEIEDLSSDSEVSNKGHGLAPSTASAHASKKFSLSSISRKLKSSFKTTAKPDLQPGDNDILDV